MSCFKNRTVLNLIVVGGVIVVASSTTYGKHTDESPTKEHEKASACAEQKYSERIKVKDKLDKTVELSLPHGIAYDSKRKDLLIMDLGDSEEVIGVDPKTGVVTRRFKIASDSESKGSFSPRGLTIDADGKIIVPLTAKEKVRVFEPDGKALQTLDFAGEQKLEYPPNAAHFENEQGSFVAVGNKEKIILLRKKKGESTYSAFKTIRALQVGSEKTKINHAYGLRFDKGGDLYFTEPYIGRLLKIDSDYLFDANKSDPVLASEPVPGLKQHFFKLGRNWPYGIDFDPYGDMYVGVYGGAAVLRFTKTDKGWVLKSKLVGKLASGVRQLVMVGCDVYAVDAKGDYIRFSAQPIGDGDPSALAKIYKNNKSEEAPSFFNIYSQGNEKNREYDANAFESHKVRVGMTAGESGKVKFSYLAEISAKKIDQMRLQQLCVYPSKPTKGEPIQLSNLRSPIPWTEWLLPNAYAYISAPGTRLSAGLELEILPKDKTQGKQIVDGQVIVRDCNNEKDEFSTIDYKAYFIDGKLVKATINAKGTSSKLRLLDASNANGDQKFEGPFPTEDKPVERQRPYDRR